MRDAAEFIWICPFSFNLSASSDGPNASLFYRPVTCWLRMGGSNGEEGETDLDHVLRPNNRTNQQILDSLFLSPGSLSVSQENGSCLSRTNKNGAPQHWRNPLPIEASVPSLCKMGSDYCSVLLPTREVEGTDCMLFIICPFFLPGGAAPARDCIERFTRNCLMTTMRGQLLKSVEINILPVNGRRFSEGLSSAS